MATTNENIVLGVDIKLKGGESVKSLKGELRDLKNQLGQLDPASKAFDEAAKRAGMLQEKIRGVNDAIENADPEKKFAPFSRTIAGLAGGFAAVQGAMALFGSESEDLQKTLVKVQGAMALSQGLNSLLEFKNDFADLGRTVIKNVVKAFTTLKGAIAATGIGLLVVTVGTLIANWKEFSAAITDAFPGFKMVTDFFKNLKQVGAGTLDAIVQGFKVLGSVVTKVFQGDFDGAIEAANTFGTKVAEAYNKGYEEEDRKIKIQNGVKDRKFVLDLEEAKGKDVKAKRVKLMQDELSILEKGSEEYNDKLIEIEKARTEIRQAEIEKKQKQDEDAKKKQDAFQKDNADRAKEFDDKVKKKEENDRARNASIKLSERERIAAENKDLEDIANDQLLTAKERYDALDALEIKGLKTAKEVSDAKIKIAQEEMNAKMQILQAFSQVLMNSSELAGKETAAGKALAVASTTIDTYVAAFRAYKEGFKLDPTGTFSIISAAAATLAGVAAVKNILKVKVPGGGGGGTLPTPVGGGAPNVPQQVNGTRLSQESALLTRDVNQGNTKVYVLESDISDSQRRIDGIKQKATIG
jgi:hypothetical protein